MSRRVEVFILGDSKSAQKAFSDLTGAAKKGETQLERTARKAEDAGRKISKSITGPVVLAAGAAVKAYAGFDAKLTQSVSIMSDVDEAMRTKMGDTAKAVSQDLNIAADVAAESYFFLASAGMSAAQSVEAMPVVARFAKAGMFDMATATDFATDAQSALGLASKDNAENLKNLTRVTDVFARANELSNLSIQQISESMTNKAGAALRLLNKDVEEGAAVLSAYADQGVKGAEAGEQLNIVLRDLQRAALKNEEAFADASVAVFDADGNMRNIADIISDLETRLDGLSDAERRTALEMLGFQDKSMSATMALLGTSDAIRTYEGELRNAGGTVERVTEKQMEAFSEKMGQAKQQIIGAAIAVGEDLAPMVLRGAEAIAKITTGFTELPGPIKSTAAAMIFLAAASGPAFVAGGKLLGTYAQLGKAVKGLTASKALVTAGTGIEAIGATAVNSSRGLGVLSAIFSPAGALVVGLAAVAGVALLVKKNVDRMKESHDSATEAAAKLADAAGITYKTIEEAAEDAGDAAVSSSEQFAQLNANAIRALEELDEAARRDFLIELGYDLVQHGATPEEAFAAVARLAKAARIELPVDLQAGDLASFEAHLEAVGGTAARVAQEIEDNWLGMGTRTKETMTGVAQSAADAFKLGNADEAIQVLARFESSIRASSLSTAEQDAAINHLNDDFAKLSGVVGWSNENFDDLGEMLHDIADGTVTTSAETRRLAEAYVAARDAGMDHAEALEEARRKAAELESGGERLEGHLQRLKDDQDNAAGAADEHADAQGKLGDEVEDTTSALEDQSNEIAAMADPVFGAQRALLKLEEAQAELAKTRKDGKSTAEDIAAAEREVASAGLEAQQQMGKLQSAFETGTITSEKFAAGMQALVDAGLIPPEVADRAIRDLDQVKGKLDDIDGTKARPSIFIDNTGAKRSIAEVAALLRQLDQQDTQRALNRVSASGAPRRHTGGVIAPADAGRAPGLAANERVTILETGEEVLTADDPRHQRNLPRFHAGGAVGGTPPLAFDQVTQRTLNAAPRTAAGFADAVAEIEKLAQAWRDAAEAEEQAQRRAEMAAAVKAAEDPKARAEAMKALAEFDEAAARAAAESRIQHQLEHAAATERLAANREQYEFDRMTTAQQIAHVEARLATEQRFSDEWMRLTEQRRQLVEQEARAAEEAAEKRRKELEERRKLQRDLRNERREWLDEAREEEAKHQEAVATATAKHQNALVAEHRRATSAIERTIEERKASLGSWLQLNERPRERVASTAADITASVREQIEVLGEWSQSLAQLRGRGIDERIIDAMGLEKTPEALGQVKALLDASDDELSELNAAFLERLRTTDRVVADEARTSESDLAQDVATLRAEHYANVQSLEADHNAVMEEARLAHQERLVEMEAAWLEREQELREQLRSVGREQGEALAGGIAAGIESQVAAIAAARARADAAASGGPIPAAAAGAKVTTAASKTTTVHVYARTADIKATQLLQMMRQAEMADV